MALKDDVKEYFSDARDALGKAGIATKNAIEKMGNEGKTRISILQTENELSSSYTELGKAVCEMVEGGRDNISRFEEPLSSILSKIESLKSKIKELNKQKQ